MDFNRRFPAPLAMVLADIDPQKFKDAVAKNHYRCAPDTVRGSRRHFDERDLIALAAFQMLTAEGISYAIAGGIACALQNTLGYDEVHRGLISVHYARQSNGAQVFGPYYGDGRGHQIDPSDPDYVIQYGINVEAVVSALNVRLIERGFAPIEL